MKKTIILIFIVIIISLIILPIISKAGCIIYLKNGRSFRADMCLDKGDTIKIEIWGGYIDIKKKDIDKYINTDNKQEKNDRLIKRKRGRKY